MKCYDENFPMDDGTWVGEEYEKETKKYKKERRFCNKVGNTLPLLVEESLEYDGEKEQIL